MDQIINFKINTELFASRSEAILALKNVIFSQGEPVIAIYGSTPQNSKIILAIGKRSGAGEGAFEIVSTGEDMTETLNIINNLKNEFTSHIEKQAGDSSLGHVITGGDIVFKGGIGTVNAAGKVKNKLKFVGGNILDSNPIEFDGSKGITVEIPRPSSEPARPLGSNTSGSSNEWSRADHTHEAPKSITGNAGSADKLSSKKTITLTGAVTGNVVTDFSGNITLNTNKNHVHEISEVTNLQENLNTLERTKAPIDNPKFTGTPTAPTPAAGTNTDQLATTAFVIKEIGKKIEAAIALKFKGTLGTGGTIKSLPSGHITGDVYVATKGAPNVSGKRLEPGDLIICIKDGSTANDSDWTVVQTNIDGAVSGPENSVSGNITVFNGTSGKIISDSGKSIQDFVDKSRNIIAGPGLLGGGDLGEDRTISHASKPNSGSNASSNSGSFITEVKIDSFGHVAEVNKGDLTGSYSAPSNEYISNITLTGNTLSGNSRPFPNIEIENGRQENLEEFISGLSVDTSKNNHKIIVQKRTIPGITVSGNSVSERTYVTGIKSDNHHKLTFTTSEESGKVKVSSDGAADYLENKILSGKESANTYSVTVQKSNDSLSLTSTINEIDGGDDTSGGGRRQVIRLKRYLTSGITPAGLKEGEIAINLADNYLYTNNGSGTTRIYSNATTTKDGLLSKEDKSRLEKSISDIDGHRTSIENINQELDVLERTVETTEKTLTDKISSNDEKLNQKIDKETLDRTSNDTTIRESIVSLEKRLTDKILEITGSGGETVENLEQEIIRREQGDKYNLDLLRFAIQRVNSSSGFEDPNPDDDDIFSNFPDLSKTHYLGGQSSLVGCLKVLDNKLYELEQALTIKTVTGGE